MSISDSRLFLFSNGLALLMFIAPAYFFIIIYYGIVELVAFTFNAAFLYLRVEGESFHCLLPPHPT